MYHIITVYDSLNYGSYFQAFAAKVYLQRFGNVDFINIHHQNIWGQTIFICAKKMLKGDFANVSFEYQKYKKMRQAQKCFKVVDIRSNLSEEDYYIFGSDEIWNVSRRKISRSKEFFGYGLPEKRRIALAPSVNTSSFEQLSSKAYIRNELKKFLAISVRDKHTKQIIDELLGDSCDLVSDPTLLIDQPVYELEEMDIPNYDSDFIVLYAYGMSLDNNTIDKIKDFAKRERLLIISVGRAFKFADFNIPASPGEFLSYVRNAKYFFTETFHGLMFSLIYKKEFMILDCGNTKVTDTLVYLGLAKRLLSEELEIDRILYEELDYQIIDKKLNEYADLTRKYLITNLEK